MSPKSKHTDRMAEPNVRLKGGDVFCKAFEFTKADEIQKAGL